MEIDLTPQTLDLELYAGDGVRLRFVVKDKNEDEVNLTGEIKAQIRDKRGETDTAEAEFSVNLEDAETGIAVITLLGDQTQELVDSLDVKVKKFVGVWDVEWTPEEDEPRTLCQGKVECWRDVTR